MLFCLALGLLAHGTLRGLVADPDSFYHLAHAAVLAEGSPLNPAFPWAARSVVGASGGDLWWGYHLLLAPVAMLRDVPASIYWAGWLGTSALLVTTWYVLGRGGAVLPLVWSVAFLAAVPNVMYRYLMARPHVLSLAAALLVASFVARRRVRAAAVAAAVLAWLHASVFWMGPLVAGAVCLADRFLPPSPGDGSRHPALPTLGWVSAGSLLGLLLRPGPLATLTLVRIQLVDVLTLAGEEGVRFGGELAPLPLAGLVPSTWLLLLPWIAAVGGLAWQRARLSEVPRPRARLLLGSALISAVYLVLALTTAARALTEWAAFGTVTVALAFSLLPTPPARRMILPLMAATFVAATPWVLGWHTTNVRLNALPPDHLREASRWLAAEAEPGDLVFHVHWDDFGPLVAWNRTTHYLGGMDPVFQLAYDRDAYLQVARLTGRGPLGADPWDVAVERYGADWALVQPGRDPALYQALRADPRWDLARLTRGTAVFRVRP